MADGIDEVDKRQLEDLRAAMLKQQTRREPSLLDVRLVQLEQAGFPVAVVRHDEPDGPVWIAYSVYGSELARFHLEWEITCRPSLAMGFTLRFTPVPRKGTGSLGGG